MNCFANHAYDSNSYQSLRCGEILAQSEVKRIRVIALGSMMSCHRLGSMDLVRRCRDPIQQSHPPPLVDSYSPSAALTSAGLLSELLECFCQAHNSGSMTRSLAKQKGYFRFFLFFEIECMEQQHPTSTASSKLPVEQLLHHIPYISNFPSPCIDAEFNQK